VPDDPLFCYAARLTSDRQKVRFTFTRRLTGLALAEKWHGGDDLWSLPGTIGISSPTSIVGLYAPMIEAGRDMNMQTERFNYAAYGSLLALMAALGSTATVFTDALASGDRSALLGCRMIYDTLIAATAAIPEYGVTADARTQLLAWLTEYRDYAAVAAQGKADLSAISREIAEGQTILDITLTQIGQRLGFGGGEH
jgi:hypothetical protein